LELLEVEGSGFEKGLWDWQFPRVSPKGSGMEEDREQI
jgi:hypothetical protein